MKTGLIDGVFAKKTREEWVEILSQHRDLIWERAQRSHDLLKDPQVLRNMPPCGRLASPSSRSRFVPT